MWIFPLLLLGICLDSGRAGVWAAALAALAIVPIIGARVGGMIWPWPRKTENTIILPWLDSEESAHWGRLIEARVAAEKWALSRWRSSGWARLAAWLGIGITFLSALAMLDFLGEAFFPRSAWMIRVATWILLGTLALSVMALCVATFGRKAGNASSAEVVRAWGGDLPLLFAWRKYCGVLPLPYAFWRYARFGIPVVGWAYHHFWEQSTTAALTAVIGVAMGYFAFVTLDTSFDLLAALNGVKVCPCRSTYLARLVWEAQFRSMHHVPLWAKIIIALGI